MENNYNSLEEAREAKKPKADKPKQQIEQEPAKPLTVKFHHCKEFNKCYKYHVINTKGIEEAIKKFKKQKTLNPTADYGGKDYQLGNHFDKQVPGLLHSGLTHDKSVFYTISGSGDTRHIHLYGIYGHDEAGIGQPANINKQKSLAKRLGNQEFDD